MSKTQLTTRIPQFPDSISLYKARANNLKNVSVDIPLNRLTVITGLSGSGKSSLAFDTLYAQSQRQYMEGLSPTLRAMFKRQPIPPVEGIANLPPVAAVDQKPLRSSTRSTVGTSTEIYDFMRVLFARLGTVKCPKCQTVLQRQSEDAIVDKILSLEEGTRLIILSPLVYKKKGTHESVLEQLRKRGLTRVRIDGEIYELDEVPKLDKSQEHSIDAVIDRCVAREEGRSRLSDSVATAARFSGSAVIINAPGEDGEWRDVLYSAQFACPGCGENLPEVQPRTFSLYSPYFETVSKCVTIQNRTISDWTAMDVDSLRPIVNQAETYFQNEGGVSGSVAQPLMEQIGKRLTFLQQAGMSYLALNRTMDTLSGGEMQRVKLSRALGCALTGICYVLDEPSIGLHSDDCARLIQTIQNIKDLGNTVVAVEHDEQFIRAADYIIDMGPGAGESGGEILAAGTLDEIIANERSVTGKWLKEKSEKVQSVKPKSVINSTKKANDLNSVEELTLTGARLNNLQHVTLSIPLGKITVVSGRSGSGKSSLLIGTLLPALKWSLSNQKQPNPAENLYDSLAGYDSLKRAVWVDQSPIGRSPRSNPATFTGIYDEIRNLFAKTKTARLYGFSASQFAFNIKGGRCERCQGSGYEKIELNLLPDLFVPCRDCGGKQFNPQTLAVKYKEKSIADVLNMSIAEASEFFRDIPKIAPTLNILSELGLGYLRLGQGANTLSGGEAQRLKLAAELKESNAALWENDSQSRKKSLYLLDEPTTGLHARDIERLSAILRRLTQQGNTVVAIEHNSQILDLADRIVELGPGGGKFGGKIVDSIDK